MFVTYSIAEEGGSKNSKGRRCRGWRERGFRENEVMC